MSKKIVAWREFEAAKKAFAKIKDSDFKNPADDGCRLDEALTAAYWMLTKYGYTISPVR